VSYYAFDEIFLTVTNDLSWVYVGKALYMSLAALFAVIGSSISESVDRRKILWSWITIGVLTTASLLMFQGKFFAFIASILMGVSVGLGFPSCLAYFAENTSIQERARVAGSVLLETFAMVVIGVVAYTILGVGLFGLVIICVALRSTSYIALFLDTCRIEQEKRRSWFSVVSHRDLLFYLVPWLMFNIASGSIWIVWSGLPVDYIGAYNIGTTFHYLGAGIFGLLGGFVADRFGRKLPVIVGMMMLGVSFALLGIAPSSISVLIYLSLSGIAWGFLIVVYAAIPGDLAFNGTEEKFYAVGTVLPFVIYFALGSIADFFNLIAPPEIFSSLALGLCLIIFMSIIPVVYAKETLPEKKIRERKIKEHIEKVSELIRESK
jgi:MFS family permease